MIVINSEPKMSEKSNAVDPLELGSANRKSAELGDNAADNLGVPQEVQPD